MEKSFRVKQSELRMSFIISTALVVQTAAALMWVGAATEKLAQLEEQALAFVTISERTARLEEQGVYVQASLDRIERKVSMEVK